MVRMAFVLVFALFQFTLGLKPSSVATYDYVEVLDLSLQFYEAQRSGPLPADNRVPWRGDSGLDDAVPGGYHDAGDLVKFGFPAAYTITVLAWGGVNFKDAYDAAGLTQRHAEALKWGTDYFIGCHTSDNELVGQIGDGYADHAEWESPENSKIDRPAFSITADAPGSDLAAETAAALAASSKFFRLNGDAEYADKCLEHAKKLFDFAYTYQGKYTDSIPAGGFYESWSGYKDELAWGAAWIASATGYKTDIDRAESIWTEMGGDNEMPNEVSWDNKWASTFLVMYDITRKTSYKTLAESFLNFVLNSPTTELGLVWTSNSQWGSLRYASNLALFAMQSAYLQIMPEESLGFAKQQINYALGDAGRSYVCGFGVNPPKRPHHRPASCPGPGTPCGWDYYYADSDNPHDLKGALVGGPDQNDQYEDDRENYVSNEVALDYNAGFQSSVAGLLAFEKQF